MRVSCYKCNIKLLEKTGIDRQKFEYKYWHCPKCKDEFLDMKQLHEVAEKERALRRAEKAKFVMWGNSLAIRIPKAMAKALGIVPGKEARVMREKNAIKLIIE